jgi:hypothetical protein
MGPVIGIVLALVFALLWALVTITRRNQLAHAAAESQHGREALREFAAQSLDLQSVDEIVVFAGQAATEIFGCSRVVEFKSGADGQWEVATAGGEALDPVPAAQAGLFGWFKHNNQISHLGDIEQARFGAMRAVLRQIMTSYEIDTLVPLVDRGSVMAVVGLQLGRSVTVVDRTLLGLFRLQATASCGNVRLHVEAAHMFSLAREADLAKTVELTLVPEQLEGALGPVSWAGHFQAAGDAGSDFFGVYPMPGGRVVVIIGDAVGVGLAGSMVSAVVKSCCDAIFDANPTRLGPSALLGALNRALYRSSNPVNTSAFVFIIDPDDDRVLYGNAGHPFPYRIAADGKLRSLPGSGPMLGDEVDANYRVNQLEANEGDVFVLFTDGLVKAENGDGRAYGDRQLQRMLGKWGQDSAAGVRDQLLTALGEYRGGEGLTDDVALLVVRYGS